MSEFKLMEHKEKPEIKCWAREAPVHHRYTANFSVTGEAYEVKFPRKMYVDAQDVPEAQLCVWSGYLQTAAVQELYREAKNV